mmetsp:Transcript_4684/g.13054  ORF Transcript_4684/g.13054 Transcript_4684/m.13054 type:complete len:426 (-) Transcript_4684:13-1290(-)
MRSSTTCERARGKGYASGCKIPSGSQARRRRRMAPLWSFVRTSGSHAAGCKRTALAPRTTVANWRVSANGKKLQIPATTGVGKGANNTPRQSPSAGELESPKALEGLATHVRRAIGEEEGDEVGSRAPSCLRKHFAGVSQPASSESDSSSKAPMRERRAAALVPFRPPPAVRLAQGGAVAASWQASPWTNGEKKQSPTGPPNSALAARPPPRPRAEVSAPFRPAARLQVPPPIRHVAFLRTGVTSSGTACKFEAEAPLHVTTAAAVRRLADEGGDDRADDEALRSSEGAVPSSWPGFNSSSRPKLQANTQRAKIRSSKTLALKVESTTSAASVCCKSRLQKSGSRKDSPSTARAAALDLGGEGLHDASTLTTGIAERNAPAGSLGCLPATGILVGCVGLVSLAAQNTESKREARLILRRLALSRA